VPLSATNEGVLTPFDSVLTSKGGLEIYLPEDWQELADTGLFQDLLRFAAHYTDVIIHRCKGKIVVPQEERANSFFMGYITELLSSQRMERITYNKDSAYHLGRQCARTKLLLMVTNPENVPQRFLKVPERFIGGTQSFKEPELIRQLRANVSADLVEKLDRLLHNLTSFTVRIDKERVKGKIGDSLFVPVSEFIHSFKRKVGRTATKAKKRQQNVVYEPVDPTKPSQLATVAPWEREMIAEIFEDPWNQLQHLIDEFSKTHPLERNYSKFTELIRKIVEQQWEQKQKILRRTRRRLDLVPESIGEELWKKLNWMREYLNEKADIKNLGENLYYLFDPYELIGTIEVIDPSDKFTYNIHSLHKQGKLLQFYPHTYANIRVWEEIDALKNRPKDGA
jgi:hypothetical protein